MLERSVAFDPMGRLETEQQSDYDHVLLINFLKKYNVEYGYINESEKTNQILKILNIGNIP